MQTDRKKQVGEAQEVLDAIGHENEAEGIKWTKHFMDKWDKKQWKQNQIKTDKLKKTRRYTKQEYYRLLYQMLQEEIKDLLENDIPPGFKVYPGYDDGGVGVYLDTPDGERYARGFKPDGTPEVDFNAVVGLLEDILITVDRLLKKNATSSGIILKA